VAGFDASGYRRQWLGMTLEGLCVLELGRMVAAPYASKLLADSGASVIKVEPPAGDDARHRGPFPPGSQGDIDASGLFLSLNTNKQSVVIDPDDEGARRYLSDELVANADIIVSNYDHATLERWGVDLEAVARLYPEKVVCVITPFGLEGPYRHYQAVELTVSHGGGWAYQSPGGSSDADEPPLKVSGHQTDLHSGVAAALACVAHYRRVVQTGVGEFIDFSTMAHTAGMLEAAFIGASYMGENPSRLGSRLLNPWGIFPCRDGLLFLVCVEQDQWERLVALLEYPEWTQMGLFDTVEQRLENEDLLRVYLAEWTSQHTVEELFTKAQAERICFAPVQEMSDMARHSHLHERGFFVDVEHPVAGVVTHLGPPFLESAAGWGPMAAAPTLDPSRRPTFPRPSKPTSQSDPGRRRELSSEPGRHPSIKRPLEGVRVIDLSWVWAGPYAAMHLAFLGAEVIKVESADRPSLGRRLALHPPHVEPSLNTCAYFNQWDQGKYSVELDLQSEDDVARFLELVAGADVVVENFACGVMERLGLGYGKLSAINPRLVMASISGYGQTGSLRHYMGYGPTTGPLSGLSALTGYEGGPPRELGISVGDPGAGITAAFAVVAALHRRDQQEIDPEDRSDKTGTHIDVALWESAAVNAVEGWMTYSMTGETPQRIGNHDPHMAPHNCYRTLGEDTWVTIACANDDQWSALAGALGLDPADPRFAGQNERKTHEQALDDLIAAWARSRDRWEITQQLQAAGVPAFPTMSPLDLLSDPHLEARGFFVRLEHPEVGRQTHTGLPWIGRVGPNTVPRCAPLLGQHNDQFLGRS